MADCDWFTKETSKKSSTGIWNCQRTHSGLFVHYIHFQMQYAWNIVYTLRMGEFDLARGALIDEWEIANPSCFAILCMVGIFPSCLCMHYINWSLPELQGGLTNPPIWLSALEVFIWTYDYFTVCSLCENTNAREESNNDFVRGIPEN